MILKNTGNKYILLCGILLLYVIAWFSLKPSYPGSDDYWYTYHAVKLFSGNFHLTPDEFQNRFGVVFPAALFIKVFGVTPYAISLWPLLAGLLTVTSVFIVACRYAGLAIASIAGVLIAANILQVTFSASLFPDVIIAFYITLIAFLVFHGRNNPSKGFLYPFLISLLLAVAFLTKETVIVLLPFMACIFISDISKKQHRVFWISTALFSLIAAGAILLLYYLLSGDPFFRFKSAFNFFHSYMINPDLVPQFTVMHSQNFLLWFNNRLGYIFIFIFALPVIASSRKINFSDFRQYMVVYSLFLMVEYIGMIHIPWYGMVFYVERMWIPLIVPLSLLSAYFIAEHKRKDLMAVAAVLLILVIVNYFVVDVKRAALFAMFFVTTAACSSIKIKLYRKRVVLLAPFIILLGYFIYANTNYRKGMAKYNSFSMYSHN